MPMKALYVQFFFWGEGGEGEPRTCIYSEIQLLALLPAWPTTGMKERQDSTAVEYLLHTQHP